MYLQHAQKPANAVELQQLRIKSDGELVVSGGWPISLLLK
jgi:hypothetical protein